MTRFRQILPLIILMLFSLPVLADTPIPRNSVSGLPDSVSTIWVLGDLEPVARALTWSALLFNSNTGSFALGVMQVAFLTATVIATLNVAATGKPAFYSNLVLIFVFALTMGPSMSVRVANAYDAGLENAGAVRFKQVDNVPLAVGLMMGTLSGLSNGTTQKINTVTQSVPDTNWSALGPADMGVLAGGLNLYGSRGMHSPLRVAIALRKAFSQSGDPLIAANMARAGRDCHQWQTRWHETREKGFLNLLTDKQQAGETSIWVPGSNGRRILTQMNCSDAGKVIAAQSLALTTPKPGTDASVVAKGISITQSTNINISSQNGTSSAARVQNELNQLPSAIASVSGQGGNDNPHTALDFAFQRASLQGGRFNPNEMAQFYTAAVQVDAASIQAALMMNRIAERCIGELDNSCAKAEQIMGEALTSSAVDAAGEATGWANTYEKFFNFMLAFYILFTILMVPVVMVKGVKSFMILGAYIGLTVWLFMIPPVQAGVGHFVQSSLTDKLYAIAVEFVGSGDVLKLLSPEFSGRVFDELNKTILTGSTIMSAVSALVLFLVTGSAYVFNGIANRAAMVGTGDVNEKTEVPRLEESRVIGADRMIEQSSMGAPLTDAGRLMGNAEARSGHSINLSSSRAMTEAAQHAVSRQLSMVDTENKTITWAHVDSNGFTTSDGFTLSKNKDGSLSLNYAQKGDQVLKDGEQYVIVATGKAGITGKMGLEALGTGGGISAAGELQASKKGTADNSVSYTDSSGQTHTLNASTSLADIQSINTSFGSIDSHSINQAYSQAVSDLKSDQHSLQSAANSTVSGGSQANIDAQHFTTIGLMADRDNATAQLAQAAAAAEKYDKGVAESIRQAYDRGGNVGADTFNALYAANSGNLSEQMAATAALKAVYGYNESPVSQSYAAMLESRMDVLDHTRNLNAEARSVMEAPVNAQNARENGNFANSLDTGRLNGIESRIDTARATGDEMGRNIRDHEKIMQHNMIARQKDMQEIMQINKELRERAPSEKLADNLTSGTAETLAELKKGNFKALLEGTGSSIVPGVMLANKAASDTLGSSGGSSYESGKNYSMNPEIMSLMERKIELEERVKNYNPNDTTKIYDNTPIEQILGYTPSENRDVPKVNIGNGSIGGGRDGHIAQQNLNGDYSHTGMRKAAEMVKRITGEQFSSDPTRLIHTADHVANKRGIGLCANGTALILGEADLIADRKHGNAQEMGKELQSRYGWSVVASGTAADRQGTIAGYTPRDGQVALLSPHGIGQKDGKGGDEHGHIAVWIQAANNGKGAWVSDYYQGDRMVPNGNYIKAGAQITILESPKMKEHFAKLDSVTQTSSAVAGSSFAAEIKQLMLKSEGGYNSVNLGEAHRYAASTRRLSEMTVNQIMAAQKRDEFNAVGKYQITESTFAEGVKALGLNGDEKFTPALQERFFNDFMIKKAGGGAAYAYIRGEHNDLNKALAAMAKEWASFPVPRDMKGHVQDVKAGQSYYHGYKGNKAHLSLNDVRSALVAARTASVR